MATRRTSQQRRRAPTDRHRFQVLQGHPESLATLVDVSIAVNATMGRVVALALSGDWFSAGATCAELVNAVSVACVTCADRYEAMNAERS